MHGIGNYELNLISKVIEKVGGIIFKKREQDNSSY